MQTQQRRAEVSSGIKSARSFCGISVVSYNYNSNLVGDRRYKSICLASTLRWISLLPPPIGPTRESRKNICMSYSIE